jgi:transcriptional regulator with XRE-family HTH domain
MGRTPHPLSLVGEFGQRVRKRRHSLGWSIEKLAEESGLNWTYVGSVERGERNVALVNIVRLATALGVDAGTLVKGLRL